MKKIVLLLAAAAVAASPALAQDAKQAAKPKAAAMTKHHKKKMTKEEEDAAKVAEYNDNSRRAVRDSLPLFLPSWSMPIFFGTHMDEKLKEGDKKPKQQ
jgi:Ni/Co efflux regulator RcnB